MSNAGAHGVAIGVVTSIVELMLAPITGGVDLSTLVAIVAYIVGGSLAGGLMSLREPAA